MTYMKILRLISITEIRRMPEDIRRSYAIIIENGFCFWSLLQFPGTVVGWLFRDLAKLAGGNLLAPGMGLFITGIVLLVADFFPRGKKIPRDIGYSAALVIGLIQGLTVFPGVSRLGIILAVCLAYGCQRKFAVKYVLLLSVPAFIGSFITECTHMTGASLGWQVWAGYVAAPWQIDIRIDFSIRKVTRVLQNKKFYGFSVYCFLIGAAAVAGSFYLA